MSTKTLLSLKDLRENAPRLERKDIEYFYALYKSYILNRIYLKIHPMIQFYIYISLSESDIYWLGVNVKTNNLDYEKTYNVLNNREHEHLFIFKIAPINEHFIDAICKKLSNYEGPIFIKDHSDRECDYCNINNNNDGVEILMNEGYICKSCDFAICNNHYFERINLNLPIHTPIHDEDELNEVDDEDELNEVDDEDELNDEDEINTITDEKSEVKNHEPEYENSVAFQFSESESKKNINYYSNHCIIKFNGYLSSDIVKRYQIIDTFNFHR